MPQCSGTCFWPHLRISALVTSAAERGWPPATRAQFDAACSPTGAWFVSGPEVRKVIGSQL